MIDDKLLLRLHNLALVYGGELHADRNEVVLCFLNSDLPDPASPQEKQADESWSRATSPASFIQTEQQAQMNQANPAANRHAVLNDMNQFLKEQEQQRQARLQYEAGQDGQKYRTGEMPYRNYPEGRPPRRSS